jgi:hypothetical protein
MIAHLAVLFTEQDSHFSLIGNKFNLKWKIAP